MNTLYYAKLLVSAALIIYCCISYAAYSSKQTDGGCACRENTTVNIYENATSPYIYGMNNPTEKEEDYLLVIGIPTLPSTTEKRMQIRLTYMAQYKEVYCPYCTPAHPNPKIRLWFFFGIVKDGLELLQAENKMFGDMVFLNIPEAMNEGKTHALLSWLTENTRARFVMKADDDSFLVIPNLIKRLEYYSPRLATTHIYYGFSMFPKPTTRYVFMAGMGYTMDFNLTRALVNRPNVRKNGNEDIIVSLWVHEAMEEGTKVIQIGNNRHFHDSPHQQSTFSWEYNCNDVILHKAKTTFTFGEAANYYLNCCPPAAKKPHRVCKAKIKSQTKCNNGTMSGIACFPFKLHTVPYAIIDNDVLIHDDELEL